jgi:hypothetical protein
MTINQFDDEPLMFKGENPNAIKDDIEKYLKNLYPLDNSSYITYVESFEYRANLPPKKSKVNIMKVPMHLSLPYKLCFLKHFNDIDSISYENHNGECVIKTLSKHLKITEKFLIKCFNDISLKLYKREYKGNLALIVK